MGSLAGVAYRLNDNTGVLRLAQTEAENGNVVWNKRVQAHLIPLVFKSFKLEVSEKLQQGYLACGC